MSSWDCSNCGLTNSSSQIQCIACFQANPLTSWSCKCEIIHKKEIFECTQCNELKVLRFDSILLISGYIREIEEEFELFTNIPTELGKIINDLYPVLIFKFGDHNKKIFKLNEDASILEGNDPPSYYFSNMADCSGYFLYADLGQYNDSGLNKGVHSWSIKSLLTSDWFSGCYASIGVTTEKNDKLIEKWNSFDGNNTHWINEGYNSHIQRTSSIPSKVTITIKLDCNNWTVTYYKDLEEFKKARIEPQQSYYFAMLCCGISENTKLQIVETPNDLLS